jgi:DNA-binding IclR family transcriptional regulator
MERDKSEAMFLLNTIWDSQVTNLNASEVSVLTCIAKNATVPGQSIPASRNKLVDQTRLAKTTVDRCLSQVIKRGYLSRAKPSDHIKPSEYLINVKKFII